MFSHKHSERRFRGVVILLGSSLLLIAALMYSFSVSGQTTTIPLGTYVATVADIGVNQWAYVDEVKVTFLENGKFLMGSNDQITGNGSYTVAGDRVEFTLPFGTDACATKGVYQWSITGNRLTLALAPGQTDDCSRRRIKIAQTYFKTDPAESFWKNVGPEGGTIRALLFYNGKIFAATDSLYGFGSAGIFVSADNGQSWKQTRGCRFSVYALTAFNGMLFAGSTSGYLYVSLDGGETWEANNGVGIGITVHSFATTNGKLYAATGQAIWQLTDNPYVWEKVTTTGLPSSGITSLVAAGGNLFASTDGNGVFISQDTINWMSVSNGLSMLRIQTLAAEGTRLYAGTIYGTPTTTPNEVFVTSDNGQNWTRFGNGLAASFPAGYFNQIFQLAPSNGRLYAASGTGLLVNDGGNWRIASQNPIVGGFLAVAVNGSQVFSGNFYDGVSRSLDSGNTWSNVNNGLTARTITAVLKDNGVLYAAGLDGGFVSRDEGQSWSRAGLPTANVFSLFAFDSKVWAGTANGIYVTANQGQTWARLSNGLGAGFVNRIAVVNNILYAAVKNAGVFRSNNNGQNWTAVNTNLTSLRVNDLTVRGASLFVGTDDKGVFRSDDGNTWSAATTDLSFGPIFSMTTSGNTILASVYGYGIYRSTDNGITWAKSEIGLSPPGVFTLYASGTNVYATGAWNAGALRSTDGGQSWGPINTGFEPRYAYGYFVDGGKLYAATVSGVCHSQNLVNASATVSAASYSPGAITEKAIVAAFGADLATSTEIASSVPLPTTLAGTSVKIRDSNGVERLAPLFFVSGGQVNYQIPIGTAVGNASVTILNGSAIGATGMVEVKATAPSIFTANSSGTGAAAAVDALTGTAGPFNAKRAGGEPNIIAVFGTGLGADATDVDGDVKAGVTARIDGNTVTLWYAGRSPGYIGLNQFNIELPVNITAGTHTLTFTRGVTSNTVTISIR